MRCDNCLHAKADHVSGRCINRTDRFHAASGAVVVAVCGCKDYVDEVKAPTRGATRRTEATRAPRWDVLEQKTPESKAPEPKVPEPKAPEQKATEPKAAEQKAPEPKPATIVAEPPPFRTRP